jgi:hypothetical protein
LFSKYYAINNSLKVRFDPQKHVRAVQVSSK